MKERQRRVDNIRRRSSETQNHLIDEYSAGKLSRREFIRRGTLLGASLPLMSFLASACGPDDATSTTRRGDHHRRGAATTAAPAPPRRRAPPRRPWTVDRPGRPSRPRPSGSTPF